MLHFFYLRIGLGSLSKNSTCKYVTNFHYLHTTVSFISGFALFHSYNSPVSVQNKWFYFFPIFFAKDFVAQNGQNLVGKGS